MKEDKCVIIIDDELPLGIIANTSAVLGVSLGNKVNEMIGNDFVDHSGYIHQGITKVPIPILKSRNLNTLREKLKQHEPDLLVVDLTNHTLNQPTFEDYIAAYGSTPVEEQIYLGIAIYGPKKLVNKHTGSMGLLR